MNDNYEKVYLIQNIEEYGKLLAYCIQHDVCIFRTYWDEREKGNRCYYINWFEKRCYYSSREYYKDKNYTIETPEFYFDQYGVCQLKR